MFSKTFCGLVVDFILAECYFRVIETLNLDVGNPRSVLIKDKKIIRHSSSCKTTRIINSAELTY